jgi:DNA polymerase (family X)
VKNSEIAEQFELLADLLEITGANPFRVRAYRSAARTIDGLASSVADLLKSPGFELTSLEGIGKDLAEKIAATVESGVLPALAELQGDVPAGVVKMLKIPGLGPKKVAALWKELGATTLEDLKAAGEKDQISQLKGFGKKTQQSILEGLSQVEEAGKRVLISIAKHAAETIAADLMQVTGVLATEVAGSCRRRKETVGDLDVLAIAEDSEGAMDCLAKHPLVGSVLARGETKQRVRLKSGLELDLRVVPKESFGAALQYFTGSKEHNVAVRKRAVELGLKVNEYGVFRGEDRVAGATEEEVYQALGLAYIPPELRENRGELEAAAKGSLPKLVTIGDIRGDLHMHTTATDGVNSIAEMALAAKGRGLEYIAITDHSKRVTMANGLDADRLRANWKKIDEVRAQNPGIQILKGIECDILEDATLDLDDEVLAEADWVLAVLHYGLKQPREQIQKRLLAAITNSHVDAIGHPSGRIVGGRIAADIGYDEIFQAAAEHGVMMEINANPSRLDLDDIQAAAAKRYGIPIVINTDAHSINGFEVLEYGVDQARRAGLTAADVANTKPWSEFAAVLQR